MEERMNSFFNREFFFQDINFCFIASLLLKFIYFIKFKSFDDKQDEFY